MKIFLVFLTLTSASLTIAQDEHAKAAEHKNMMIKRIDKEISMLQNTKTCLMAANDHEAQKKCHEASKAEHEKLKAEHQHMKNQKTDEQIKHLEAEKK